MRALTPWFCKGKRPQALKGINPKPNAGLKGPLFHGGVASVERIRRCSDHGEEFLDRVLNRVLNHRRRRHRGRAALQAPR